MISVIIPVYNVENYLEKCIESIMNQTYTDFELILVDDGSTDDSKKICDKYAEQYNNINVIHKNNNGAASALNEGLDWIFANSDSEWITIVDGDDWVHPQMLEIMNHYADKTDNKLIAVDYAEYRILSDIQFSNIDIDKVKRKNIKPEDFFVNSKGYNNVVWWGKLYHRSCFENIRYPVVKQNADSFITYKILFCIGDFLYIQNPLYYHFINPDSISNRKWSPIQLKVIDADINQMIFFDNNGYEEAKSRVAYSGAQRIHDQFWAIIELDRSKEYEKYIKLLRKLMRRHLKKCKNVNSISIEKNPEFYHIAYPHTVGVYYRIKRMVNK